MSILLLFIMSFAPSIASAAALPIGAECTGNNDCRSGDCETSTKDGKRYCDCDDAVSCKEYGDTGAERWTCEDGADATYDLDYCIDTAIGKVYYPITPQDTSLLDQVLDPALTLDEIQRIQNKPQTQITIPGVSFSDVTILPPDEDGTTFLQIPFLGEYIAAIYKYAVILAAIISVLVLIISGFTWTISAGDAGTISKAKGAIGNALIGLILSVGSYTILYTINPALVSFGSLKVRYIEGASLSTIYNADFRSGERSSIEGTDAAGLNTPSNVHIPVQSSRCEQEKSQSSGIGTTELLGRLDCSATRKRTLSNIKVIVLHEGGKAAESTVNYWVKRCETQDKCASSHYYVDRDGTIHQLLDESKIAYHTPGKGEYGYWNNASIGIDLQTAVPGDRSTYECLKCAKNGTCKNYSGKTVKGKKYPTKEEAIAACLVSYTEAQYAALNTLINSIVSRTSVVKNGNQIRSHCNTGNNHGDPQNFNWSKIGVTPKAQTGCLYYPAYQTQNEKRAAALYNE